MTADLDRERWCSRCRRSAPPVVLVKQSGVRTPRSASVCRECVNAEAALHFYFHDKAARALRNYFLTRHPSAA